MSPQERLEAEIWQAYIDRPFRPDVRNSTVIYDRIPEDDVREEFFKSEILKRRERDWRTTCVGHVRRYAR
jgi:hypothetical protein